MFGMGFPGLAKGPTAVAFAGAVGSVLVLGAVVANAAGIIGDGSAASGWHPMRIAMPDAAAAGKPAFTLPEAPVVDTGDTADTADIALPDTAAPTSGALAGLTPVPSVHTAPFPRGSRADMMAVDFDLSRWGRAPSSDDRGKRTTSIKSVRFDAEAVGRIEVWVGDDAIIFVRAEDMAQLLSSDAAIAGRIAAAKSEMLSLGQLRDLGLTVRYDPIADAIEMQRKG